MGKSVSEVIGTTLREYFPADVANDMRTMGIEVVKTGKPVSFETNVEGKWYSNRIFPIQESQGKITHLAIYGVDVTNFKLKEEAFYRRQQMLSRTEMIAHIGSWEWRTSGNTVLKAYCPSHLNPVH